ncbi:MAG: hypothetical protein JNL11_20065 [Bdellovibrionaceae bacterium]|nr:hypothetical protein [Pseudobdellovibrionaceae bacterium]
MKEQNIQNVQSWSDFQKAMEKLKNEDRQRGTSYIVSGAIVSLGSLVAISGTHDAAAKLIYGIASSGGIAAITYGISTIYYGNSYNSFYDAVGATSLSEDQRNVLVKNYLASEREQRQRKERLQMIAHFVASVLNVYSASVEKDDNAKTFLHALAGLNLALGISYSF